MENLFWRVLAVALDARTPVLGWAKHVFVPLPVGSGRDTGEIANVTAENEGGVAEANTERPILPMAV